MVTRTDPYHPPSMVASEDAPAWRWGRPARPHHATAMWFVFVFAMHVGLGVTLAIYAGGDLLNFTPVYWLVLSAGLYLRLGPIRRFVLLFGGAAIAAGAATCLAEILQPASPTSITIAQVVIEAPPPWASPAQSFAVVLCFLYPVWVLWPTDVRRRFRDRLTRIGDGPAS